MHKLVILIEPPAEESAAQAGNKFEAQWPAFLRLVEGLPGLRREATSRVEHFLYGQVPYVQVHELFFDTYNEAEQALGSSRGQEAGRMLQQMTGGRMSLFLADHKEDDLANILKHRRPEAEGA
jgi:hypothetical protein